MRSKTVLAATAALSLLAAAGAAHATIVATLPVTVTGSEVSGLVTINGSGSGVLDSNGTFTVDTTQLLVATPENDHVTLTVQDTFTGVLSPGGFTVTGDTLRLLSCAGSSGMPDPLCDLALASSVTAASGFFSSAGGTLMTTVATVDTPIQATYTVGAVPLPPAVLLLGSGLLGL